MKLWLQYILAAAAGILLAFLLPENAMLNSIMLSVAEFGIRLGRFILFPLLFFTLSVSVCQLRRDRQLLKMSLKLIGFSAAAVVIHILISMGLALILPVDRIPIVTETSGWESLIPFRNNVFTPSWQESLRSLIPVNAFEIFRNNADFILPALLFAFVLGTQLFHDREEAEPVYNFFDSFGRMMYRMNAHFVHLFSLILIPLSYLLVRQITGITDFSSYFGMLRILLIATAVILFGIQPLFYYLLTRKNPYSEMKVFSAGLIASLISGDSYINQLVLTRTLKENGGVKRKLTGFSLPFLTMFSRAGTAMITSVCLLTILKSYSSLELTAFQIFWVMGSSVLVSALLFAQSHLGVYTALIITCGLYGRGLTEGYILILPVLPVLIILSGILDAANAAFITLVLSSGKELRFPEDPVDYI